MRINILSHPRSGSNYLYDIFTQAYPNHHCYFEPNRISKDDVVLQNNISKSNLRQDGFTGWGHNDIITKNHVYHEQPPGSWTTIKIIRKDLFEASLSFALGLTSKNFVLNNNIKYEVKEEIYDWALDFIFNQQRKMKDIISDYTIYYEDLTFNPNLDLEQLGFKTDKVIEPISKMADKESTILNYNELRNRYEKANLPSLYW